MWEDKIWHDTLWYDTIRYNTRQNNTLQYNNNNVIRHDAHSHSTQTVLLHLRPHLLPEWRHAIQNHIYACASCHHCLVQFSLFFKWRSFLQQCCVIYAWKGLLVNYLPLTRSSTGPMNQKVSLCAWGTERIRQIRLMMDWKRQLCSRLDILCNLLLCNRLMLDWMMKSRHAEVERV